MLLSICRYDENGNTTITPTSGNKTITSDTEYSCGGNFISAVIDTFSKRTEYDYDPYTAQLKSAKDAKSTITRYVNSDDLLTKVYVDADSDTVYDANETGVQYTSTRVSQLEVGNEDHTRTFKYWYDSLGNIYCVYDPSAVLSSWDYSFDQKGQLVFTWHCDEDGSGIDYEYTYDNAGNLLSKKAYTAVGWDPDTLLTTDTYTYSDSVWGDLLTAYNGQPISYDANGNPLSYRGMTLTWAKGRRLATLTKNSATATCAYDRDGLRVQKTVGGVTHTYTYLGDRLVCEEWGGSYLEYIYDETGRPYGLVYGNGSSQNYYYFVRNLQGDVTELLEMNGETVAFYEYDPWVLNIERGTVEPKLGTALLLCTECGIDIGELEEFVPQEEPSYV